MHRIQIEQITEQRDLEKIKHLINGYSFKPYYSLKQFKNTDIDNLFKWKLSEIISDRSNFILVAKKKNNYLGFIILEKQIWDSSFFGFPCYRVEHIYAQGDEKIQINIKSNLLKLITSLCKEKKIRYLNVKVDTQDRTSTYLLESLGFYLVSIMLHLAYFTNKDRRHFKQLGKVRPYMPKDLESLRKIAGNSMYYDHFHSDSHFSKETSDKIYETLIKNCCNGIAADKVYVAERTGKVVGYVACEIRHKINKILPLRIGQIRHLAVSHPDGFGCGPGLQETALNWFQDKVDVIESATTVQNLPIIKISLKSGMNIVASYLRFSKWFDE